MSELGSATELKAWREHPVSAAMIEWLKTRIETHRRDIPEFVVKNRVEDARAASGSLKGYVEILDAIMEEPAVLVEETEETFIDPASRPSTREAT